MNIRSKNKYRSILRDSQSGLCCYCERPMARHGETARAEAARLGVSRRGIHKRRETIEHLQQLAKGGTSHRDNLALACKDCNSRRGDTDWLTYKSQRMGELRP